MNTHFDLVILGGGPAGSRAALDAARAGMAVALVEAGFLGGTCLNAGCIPTKFLLGATAYLPLLEVQQKNAAARGEIRVDLAALQAGKDAHVKEMRAELAEELRQAGVTVLHGKGAFTGPASVHVKGAGVDAEATFGKCIVATGSIPAVFPGLKPDGATVYSSAGILGIKEIPESLIILGGGAIGLEMGEFFHRLGTRIIMAEGASRMLPGEDCETGETVRAYHERRGWEIHTGRRIASLSTVDGRSLLRFEDGEEKTAACSLLAAGRMPGTRGLNPEGAGLTLNERGWLQTDECLRAAEHIYAVGDINARLMMSHAATHQAAYAVRRILGTEKAPYSPPAVPACIYGTLEVMRVGPTAAELARQGVEVRVSRSRPACNPVARGLGHTAGVARMVWADGALMSVTVVGHGASHLMAASSLLVKDKLKKNLFPGIIFAHPTLDEVLESAILARLET